MRWSEPATLALVGSLAFAASAAITAWARRYATRRGLLDQPGARRSHAVATPRGGGVGIAVVGLVLLATLAMGGDSAWWWVAAGLLLVAAAGWWDDHRPTSPALRLALHALAGMALALALRALGASPLAALGGCVLAMGLVNVWNFMDGIDGLAASQGALCAAALLLTSTGPMTPLALGIVAACLGFLPYNLPRARIFLGDVGSGAIGFLLAALLAFVALDRTPIDVGVLLLALSAFLVDAGLTLGWRVLRGERWWTPHVEHLYQRASRRFGHGRVTLAYAGWTIAAVGVMLVAIASRSVWALAAVAGAWVLALALWLRLHQRWSEAMEGLDR